MLLYELNVRGIKVDDSKTVDELRSTLRPLLQMEKKGRSLSTPPYDLKFEDEKTYILTTLTSITTSLKTITGEKAKCKYERFQSRLIHLLNRVNRIPIPSLSDEESAERSSLLVKVLGALDQLSKISQQDPHLSMLLESTHISKDNDSDVSSESSSSGGRPLSRSQPTVYNKYPKVEKWGLKFTGDPRGMSVHSFLERATELCVARRVSEKDLFDAAIDLFEGKALTWYRANRSRFSNWKSLSDLLCKHFEPPDYHSRLFKEILERTQDPSESIVEYLASMSALFNRYGGVPEELQLDIVSRNLSPFYLTQLPPINSLSELEDECLKLEAKKYRAEAYVPPSRKKKQQLVEPDFAFVCHDSNPDSKCIDVGSSPYSSLTSSPQVGAVSQWRDDKRKIICWNCKSEGHVNRDCPKPKMLHCFRCGTPDVTVRSCPKCNTSGNEPRGSH